MSYSRPYSKSEYSLEYAFYLHPYSLVNTLEYAFFRAVKRSEINLKKHLAKKKSILRIQNSDDLCLARSLVVAKAKIDSDPQYKSIVDNRWAMQIRLAQELHQKASGPLGPCGLDEVKHFQAYLSEYQVNDVSKEYMNIIMYTGPEQEKRIYLYMHNNHYDVITKMPGFFHEKGTATPARRPTIIIKSIYVPTSANVAVFQTAL